MVSIFKNDRCVMCNVQRDRFHPLTELRGFMVNKSGRSDIREGSLRSFDSASRYPSNFSGPRAVGVVEEDASCIRYADEGRNGSQKV